MAWENNRGTCIIIIIDIFFQYKYFRFAIHFNVRFRYNTDTEISKNMVKY